MNIKVIPVTIPQIDWDGFVTEANAALGRSPTDSLDAAGIVPGSPRTFIAALGEFLHPGTSPVSYLRTRACDKALEHLSFGFLFVPADGVCPILALGKANVLLTSDNKAALVSGTLRQWREIFIEGCHHQTHIFTRQLLNDVCRHLIRFGFGDLFADLETRDMKDGTFALESRNR